MKRSGVLYMDARGKKVVMKIHNPLIINNEILKKFVMALRLEKLRNYVLFLHQSTNEISTL